MVRVHSLRPFIPTAGLCRRQTIRRPDPTDPLIPHWMLALFDSEVQAEAPARIRVRAFGTYAGLTPACRGGGPYVRDMEWKLRERARDGERVYLLG